jgi:hypothetical protein
MSTRDFSSELQMVKACRVLSARNERVEAMQELQFRGCLSKHNNRQ